MHRCCVADPAERASHEAMWDGDAEYRRHHRRAWEASWIDTGAVRNEISPKYLPLRAPQSLGVSEIFFKIPRPVS